MHRRTNIRSPFFRMPTVTEPPHDPPPDHRLPIPVSYSPVEIEFLRDSWNLTPKQRHALPLLLSWMVPKEIGRELKISTRRARGLVDEIRDSAKLCDGAEGIRKGAPELIARWHENPGMSPYEDEERN